MVKPVFRRKSYDALNRVATAATQATYATDPADCWGQGFGYDAWGNLTNENVTQCSAPMLSASPNGQNQLTDTAYTYDASGNMTHDALHAYTYDAESEITAVDTGTSYVYSSDGQRLEKVIAAGTTSYVYSGGRVVAEYNAGTGWIILMRGIIRCSTGDSCSRIRRGSRYAFVRLV